MINAIIEALYNKVFVNIVVNRVSTDVYIEVCSKKNVIEHDKESFDTTTLDSDLLEYINSYIKESPYFYISFLDISVEQGVFPTCEQNRLGFYGDLSASEYKCCDKKWTYFTSKTELYAMEKQYSKLGIDFIFSPYSLLHNFFEDKISTSLAMYVLVQDNYLSLSIFNKGELLYGEQLDMDTTDKDDELLHSIEEDDEDIDLEIQESINLDDVDDVMQDLDDFGDIEDLDAIADIDEFSQDKDLEEELTNAALESKEKEEQEVNFNEDYQRFSLIQTSLNHFYNDEKYEGVFIETIYIADNIGVSGELKHYLEEEMFLNVYLRRIDISMEICSLAKIELDS